MEHNNAEVDSHPMQVELDFIREGPFMGRLALMEERYEGGNPLTPWLEVR
jgi:hypothetical protein